MQQCPPDLCCARSRSNYPCQQLPVTALRNDGEKGAPESHRKRSPRSGCQVKRFVTCRVSSPTKLCHGPTCAAHGTYIYTCIRYAHVYMYISYRIVLGEGRLSSSGKCLSAIDLTATKTTVHSHSKQISNPTTSTRPQKEAHLSSSSSKAKANRNIFLRIMWLRRSYST